MSINDKIKQILIDRNLSPSYFADEIGVQRSSISHILSGRNRPSFDIIQKIIRRFPDLGYEWIMEEDTQSGTLAPPSNYNGRVQAQPTDFDRSARSGAGSPTPYNPSPVNSGVPRNEIAAAVPAGPQPIREEVGTVQSESARQALPSEKKIERILIFFSDGSFKDYSPVS